MVSKNIRDQATVAVNNVLATLLPGAAAVSVSKHSKKNGKVSKAHLIDSNLKKRLELHERDVQGIKRKEKKLRKAELKKRRVLEEEREQIAKKNILAKHKKEGNLSKREKEYLQALAKRNTKNLKAWDLDEETEADFIEVQNHILETSGRTHKKSNKRRQRVKEFKEELSTKSFTDHRYPGLTPGLAPVGLSDEEESSDEE
ncbi:Regulator of rDNA transcription protein 14 [Nakaseomyces bracarensis]|uniref:Regulator of rDNA transcription 14 n=1 Tax=Nakaseomyces bracarensis TaxID=273131 RepID=A0ABR4NZ33_9SACH